MRYTLDENGYVKCVLWGCMSGDCQEYTGEVPAGYSSLADWAENACINAYYIENGNLVLDSLRQSNLQLLYEQQAIDYSPVLHKDLFETHEIIDAQYKKNTVRGLINVIEDARSLAPMVRVDGLTADKITIFSQSKNMLPINFKSETKGGLTFTAGSGYFSISGTAYEDVEYTIAGGGTDPIFALLSGYNYRLEIGSCSCEMIYFDGETTQQVYSGSGGTISLSEDKAVTQIKLKIPSGTAMNETIWPTLSFSDTTLTSDDAQGEVRSYTIDLSGYDLVSSSYVLIGGGLAALYSGGTTHVLRSDNLRLLNGYNMIYTDHENYLEITYTSNELQVDDMAFLQGKSTTTKKFMILEDGSIIATNGQFSGEVTCTKLTVSEDAPVEGIDLPTDEHITQITKDTVKSEYLVANNLHINGGSISINSSGDTDIISLKTADFIYGASGTAVFLRPNGIFIVSPDASNINRVSKSGAEFSMLEVRGDASVKGSLLLGGDIDVGNQLICQDSYDSTVSYNANMYVGTTGRIRRTTNTSSREIKDDIKALQNEDLKAENLYNAEVVQFKYKEGILPEEDMRYRVDLPGLIVEDLEKVYPIAVDKDENGKPFGWNTQYLIPPMLQLIQEQKKEIEALKLRIERLEEASK